MIIMTGMTVLQAQNEGALLQHYPYTGEHELWSSCTRPEAAMIPLNLNLAQPHHAPRVTYCTWSYSKGKRVQRPPNSHSGTGNKYWGQ